MTKAEIRAEAYKVAVQYAIENPHDYPDWYLISDDAKKLGIKVYPDEEQEFGYAAYTPEFKLFEDTINEAIRWAMRKFNTEHDLMYKRYCKWVRQQFPKKGRKA